jgi:hypothetical protein
MSWSGNNVANWYILENSPVASASRGHILGSPSSYVRACHLTSEPLARGLKACSLHAATPCVVHSQRYCTRRWNPPAHYGPGRGDRGIQDKFPKTPQNLKNSRKGVQPKTTPQGGAEVSTYRKQRSSRRRHTPSHIPHR